MGGGSQKEPNVQADNLFAQDVAELVYSFGEGTILGLVDGLKTFYAGGTPILSNTDEFNFQDFAINFRQGYGDDLPIHYLLGGESSNIAAATGATLPYNVLRSFTTDPQYQGQINFLDLRLAITRLFNGNKDGDQEEGIIAFQIRYKKSSDTTWTYVTESLLDQLNSKYTDETIRRRAIELGLNYDLMTDAEKRDFYDSNIDIVLPADDTTPVTEEDILLSDEQQESLSILSRNIRNGLWTAKRRKQNLINSRKAYLDSILIAGYSLDDIINKYYVFTGKTTSGYIAEISIPMPENPNDDWDIEVLNITKDLTPAEQLYSAREASIETIAMVTQNDRVYPNTVMCQIITQSTDRFPTIPDFYADFLGLICEVPTNYNPFTHEYDGIWDGNYKKAWTNNPVWILRELIMNPSWGMRRYQLNINVSNSNFYTMAQYCDEKLLDFNGTMSPRHTFNATVTDFQTINEFAKYVAGTFHGTLKERSGVYSLFVDRMKPCGFFVGLETVTQDGFSYSKSNLSTRYNLIRLTYNSKKNGYEEDRRVIIDADSIAKYGVIEYGFQALGVTNHTEAVRQGAYMLLTNRDECVFAKFKAPRIGHIVNLYDHFYLADRNSGFGNSARILDFDLTTKRINLRDPIIANSVGEDYKISFHTPMGIAVKYGHTIDPYTIELTKEADNSPITEDDLEWLLDEAPIMIEGDTYGFAKAFRILGIVEPDDDSVPQGEVFEISAALVSESKYTELDTITSSETLTFSFDLTEPPTEQLNNVPPRVKNIAIYVKDYANTDGLPMYDLSFDPSEGADYYLVKWIHGKTGEVRSVTIYTNEAVLAPAYGVDALSVNFTITPFTAAGVEGQTAYFSRAQPDFQLVNDSNLPDFISASYDLGFNTVVFTWEPNSLFSVSHLIFNYRLPDGTVRTTTGLDLATSFSVPYVGAGQYSLQVTYVLSMDTTIQIKNDVWKADIADTANMTTPSVMGIVSSYTVPWATEVEAGKAWVLLKLNIGNYVTITRDLGKVVEFEFELETAIGSDTYAPISIPVTATLVQYSASDVNVELKTLLQIGRKLKFRTKVVDWGWLSNWVTITIPDPSGASLPDFDPEQIYVSTVNG